MATAFIDYLLEITQSTQCKELETIQGLWSGYGRIVRYQLDHPDMATVVVKYISLQPASQHPRGWNTNYSHNRKVKSYEVETNWYKKWADRCDNGCRIPQLIGTFAQGHQQWIIMEDLNTDFPLRKTQINLAEVQLCLSWLAHFHAKFLQQAPLGLWDIGTYWHLATRPDEFKKIEHPQLKAKAQYIDDLLNQCKYKSIVHGDAKLANFCFAQDSRQVAAVDFQYVGGGCGMKDVAYFLGSCLSAYECKQYEQLLLDYYFKTLREAIQKEGHNIQLDELETEWRSMYPIACTDFTRFLMGWMPAHHKINSYSLEIMEGVIGK